MLLGILLTLFFVFANGFFVAAEFAIVKVRSSQIEIRQGRTSEIAKTVVANLDGYLAATQLGITIASLALGWIGEDVFTEIILKLLIWVGIDINPVVAHKLAIPVAFLSITILHIVLGELAPKSLAIRKALPVTFAIAVPLRIFYIIFRPFIWLLNGLANILLKMIGIQPVGEGEEIHTEEELKVIIAESQKGGVIEATEKELIQNVFNLGDRQIQTLMTPRNEVVWLNVNDSAEQVKHTILDHKHSVYPVCDELLDNVVGFLYTKDLIDEDLMDTDFATAFKGLRTLCRKEQVVILTNKAYTVLESFQKNRCYQALVIDEFGSVRGFVTINDILDALVGNISETDEFEYSSMIQEDGSLVISGQIPFVEFVEKLGLDPDIVKSNSDYVTLGGYIMSQLDKVPVEGNTAQWESFQLEVLKMDHNRIDMVKVTQTE